MITAEQFSELLDVLWEIKHELAEIRRNLSVPETQKQEEWRKASRKRIGL